jgi:hypothetical protein
MARCKFTSQRVRVLDDGCHVVRLDAGEIWENAELIAIRDTFLFLHQNVGISSMGVDLLGVKYLPSGFFGLLYDWHERGVSIHLYSPEQEIAKMLWYRQFFRPVRDNGHVLDSTFGGIPAESQTIAIDKNHHLVADTDNLRLLPRLNTHGPLPSALLRRRD